jgi:hypothetical protein
MPPPILILALLAARPAVVRVVDAETGRPLPGAVVAQYAGDVMAVADSTGSSRVPLPHRDRRVTAFAAGYTRLVASVHTDTATVGLFRELVRPLVGRIVDAARGGPLPGARVALAADTVTAGPGGDFGWDNFAPGPQVLVGHLDGYCSDSVTVVARGGETTTVTLRLRDTTDIGSVAGTVTDRATGLGIAGASLCIAAARESTAADSAGRYRIERLAAGEYWLVAGAPGFAAQQIRFRVLRNWAVCVDFRLTRVP